MTFQHTASKLLVYMPLMRSLSLDAGWPDLEHTRSPVVLGREVRNYEALHLVEYHRVGEAIKWRHKRLARVGCTKPLQKGG